MLIFCPEEDEDLCLLHQKLFLELYHEENDFTEFVFFPVIDVLSVNKFAGNHFSSFG